MTHQRRRDDNLARARLCAQEFKQLVQLGFSVAQARYAVGRRETGRGGRSFDLALLIASASHRWQWRLTKRTVATGRVEVEGGQLRILGVDSEELRGKLEALLRDTASTTRPTVLLCPKENAADVAHFRKELITNGVELQLVHTFDELLRALPLAERQSAPADRRFISVIGFCLWLWWAERFFGGEFLADPLTRASFPMGLAVVGSALPALVPALTATFAGYFARGRALWWALPLASIAVFASGSAFVMLQRLLGLYELPATPYMLRGETFERIGCIVKDTAFVYPLLTVVFVVFAMMIHGARQDAWRRRSSGLVSGVGWRTTRGWARLLPRSPRLFVVSFTLIALVHIEFFREDLMLAFRVGNAALALHMGFQILWACVIGSVVWLFLDSRPQSMLDPLGACEPESTPRFNPRLSPEEA